MIKLLTIIGARPQIIKASALSRAIREGFADQVTEVLVHTGQHYDQTMSAVFFDELSIPQPKYNLQVGSGNHGQQTGRMLTGIEELLVLEKPDCVVIYGDTNSTLAGAMAAAKLHIPIAHVEAGLRSYNKLMPEEINRIMADHVSTFLFPPTQAGVANLAKEGFSLINIPPYTIDNPGVVPVGDVMYDNALHFSALAAQRTDILNKLALTPNEYVLVTLHRTANTDDPVRLNAIFEALQAIATNYATRLVIPVHPRTAKQMQLLLNPDLHTAIRANPTISLLPPVSFLEMLALEQKAQVIITDSGGVQKEAYFFRKPCIILRAETEWVELVEQGAAVLCDADQNRIWTAYDQYSCHPQITFVPVFGDGQAAHKIVHTISTIHTTSTI